LSVVSCAWADIAYKSYFDYQNVNLGATQRLRLMSAPSLGSISSDIHYELSAHSNGDLSAGFDRLNLKWNNWTIGRDAVSFGVGRIWSPNDLFAPFAPTEIDKDYKTGIDLIRYDQAFTETNDATLLYTPVKETKGSYVGRVRAALGSFGASLIAGKLNDDTTYGFTFDGPVGGAGFRGSVNCLASAEGNAVYKFILGSDYMFPNNLYIVSEYYYNGSGSQNPANYDLTNYLAGNIFNLAQHYLAFGYSLDFLSLWNSSGYVISNLDDGSRLYWEEINYSLSDESNIKSGVILSSGGGNSEYAAFSSLIYTLLSVYL
jgi:hypothetical protein